MPSSHCSSRKTTMADLMPLPRTGPGSGPAMTAQLIHQSTTLWNSSLWPSGAVTVASSMPQQQQSSPAARAQRPARVAPPPEPIDDGLMPVADAEVDSGRTVVEVTGYSSIDVMGYGQVNGYEFIFAGGGRLCYGVCKGRREPGSRGVREVELSREARRRRKLIGRAAAAGPGPCTRTRSRSARGLLRLRCG